MRFDEIKKAGRIFSGGQWLTIICFILVILIGSCVFKKTESRRQTNTVRAIFKTEHFTLRTDSLFPDGLMRNIEIYDEPDTQLNRCFYFADSGKWGELTSDTIGGELMLFHGVKYYLDSIAPIYLNYEMATYYIKKPLNITIIRNNKIDATFIAGGISKIKIGLILLHGYGANGPPGKATPFQFGKYSLTSKIRDIGW